MYWDKLTTALTGGIEGLSLDDGSSKVILIAPRPEDVALPRIRIITKAVNQLLWEQDSIERGRNHRQLYRTLRQEPSAKCFTGTLFELQSGRSQVARKALRTRSCQWVLPVRRVLVIGSYNMPVGCLLRRDRAGLGWLSLDSKLITAGSRPSTLGAQRQTTWSQSWRDFRLERNPRV